MFALPIKFRPALLLPLLLIVPATYAQTAPPTALGAPQASKWEKEIAAFEAADKEQFPAKGGVVFVGSSSIRMWKTLQKDFPESNVINRGFGGSMIPDSVEFADRIVIPYEPKLIVFYAGGNDINAKRKPDQVFADWKTFVQKVHTKLPETKILFISITGNPRRWNQVEDVKTANALIEAYNKQHPYLGYVDVFHPMLNAEGQPRKELFSADDLHMSPAGYVLWKEILTPYIPKQKG